MVPRAHERETMVLLCVAFTLFLLRFWGLGAIPFVSDEPSVQSMIDRSLRHGQLPVSGLMSTRMVPYGPTSQWGFLPVRAVTPDIVPLALENVLLFGAALLLVFLAVRSCMGENTAAWTATLAASSPYLFYYSRVLWETTFIILTSAMLVLAVTLFHSPRRREWWTWAWLGLSAGLALDTHLLMVPFIGVATAFCVWSGWRHRVVRPASAGLGVLAFACVAGPYLWIVHGQLLAGTHTAWSGFPASVPGEMFTWLSRYLSFDGMQYFFDWPPAKLSELWQGRPWAVLFVLRPHLILTAAGAGAGAWYAYRLWRRRAVPPVVTVGLSALALTIVYYMAARPPLAHPHYLLVLWWLPFLLAGSSLSLSRGAWRVPLKCIAAWSVALNLLFVVSAQTFIQRNHGTRGPHYGTVAEAISDATRRICTDLAARGMRTASVDLGATPGVLPPSMGYFSRHLPECAGKYLIFIPASGTGALPVKTAYPAGSATDASLELLPS